MPYALSTTLKFNMPDRETPEHTEILFYEAGPIGLLPYLYRMKQLLKAFNVSLNCWDIGWDIGWDKFLLFFLCNISFFSVIVKVLS